MQEGPRIFFFKCEGGDAVQVYGSECLFSLDFIHEVLSVFLVKRVRLGFESLVACAARARHVFQGELYDDSGGGEAKGIDQVLALLELLPQSGQYRL